MDNFKMTYQYVDSLKTNYPGLTDYEALKIAVEIERNAILVAGLGVSQSNQTPAFLEAIAMKLGINLER